MRKNGKRKWHLQMKLQTKMKVSDKIMKQLPIIFVALLTIFAFEACKVGPGFKAQRNEIDSTAVYRYDSLQLAMQDSVLNIEWWELFDDPVLDTLIDIGLSENKDILVASSRIEQARAQLGFTKANMWPSIGYQGADARGNVFQGLPSDNAR